MQFNYILFSQNFFITNLSKDRKKFNESTEKCVIKSVENK